jgi:hypothetical protein
VAVTEGGEASAETPEAVTTAESLEGETVHTETPEGETHE